MEKQIDTTGPRGQATGLRLKIPRNRIRRLLFLLLTAATLLMVTASPSRAFDLELAVGGGYDDNPRELEKASGAAFTEARLEGNQKFSPATFPDTVFTLQGFAGGRLYNNVDNIWMAGGEIASSTSLNGFPGQLEFFTRAATFHNPEIDDDDYDQLKVGGRLAWFASPRLTVEWENFLSWEDYGSDNQVTGPARHPDSLPDTDFGRNRKGNPGHDPSAPGHRPRHHNRGERDDRVMGTALRSLFAFNPYWDASGEIFWQNRHSSLDAEKSHTYGLELGLFWHPFDNLELALSANAARTPYHYDLRQESRTEKSYGSTISLTWKFAEHWSLSGSWEWYRQDSDIETDEYTRNQWYTHVNFSY